MSYDQKTPLLILKTSRLPLHHGTLGVIRSLGRAGVPVYSSREPGGAPAAKSRYLCAEAMEILSPSDYVGNVAALRAFQRRVGRPLAILPVDDAGALFVAENAEALRPDFLLPPQKPNLPRMLASKANNPQLCASLGVATPETFVLSAADDLPAPGPPIRFPAVVKIAQPWLAPKGFPRAVLVHGAEELTRYRARLQARSTADVVVQEYIPEDQAEDWFYHGYHRAGGEAVVSFTGRKLRSYPPFFGPTTYARSIVNEEVLAISCGFLRSLGYAGIVELEFRFDKRDGRYKFIDFNPRLGAQFQFLRNDCGIDVVRAMHLDLTGRPVPEGRQAEGRTFVSDFYDVAAFMAYWRRRAVSPIEWLGQLFAADEHAWFAIDDLSPFRAALGQSVKRFVTAAIRRARRGGDEMAQGQPLRSRRAYPLRDAPAGTALAASNQGRDRS